VDAERERNHHHLPGPEAATEQLNTNIFLLLEFG
jgi:hypothetical protein